MFISIDSRNVIKAVSNTLIKIPNTITVETDNINNKSVVVGKHIRLGPRKQTKDLRIAIICNWGQPCGISTYTESLIRSLKERVDNIKVFAEHGSASNDDYVVECWKRGQSMVETINQILDWKPDIVHVQHEFGIFPKATHFLKMIELLD